MILVKVLFVNACIRKESRTLVLCREYLNRFKPDEVEEVNLQELKLLPFNVLMLNQRNADIEAKDWSGREYDLAKKFAAADRIVIGAPFWDYSFPACLKVYFEHICVNGITFGYSPDGTPLSLCKAEKLAYITTAGGYISKRKSCEAHIRDLCDMFSIQSMQFICAEGLDIIGNDPQKILASTLERIRNTE